MNPFTLQENRHQYGDKKKFYFSQFKKIKDGFDNAVKVDLLGEGTVKECRMYLNLYLNSKEVQKKAKTKVVGGDLWVAIIGDK